MLACIEELEKEEINKSCLIKKQLKIIVKLFLTGSLFFPLIFFYNLFCVGLYGFFFFGFSDFESKALGLDLPYSQTQSKNM